MPTKCLHSSVYIDGADEIDGQGHMVKGGGAALTREKIVAALAERFVCIADESKVGKGSGPVSVASGSDPNGGAKPHCAPFCGYGWNRPACASRTDSRW